MIGPRQRTLGVLGGALLLGFGALGAASAEQPMNVQSEIQALKAEVAQLRAKDNESWLTERRAEEVKTLIRDVLSDADTRASLAEGGMTAGYNKHFFLANEDGSFLMDFAGQLQFRYIFNNRQNAGSGEDNNQGGFQFRRAKFKIGGHIYNDIGYKIVIAAERGDGTEVLEESWMSFKLADGLKLVAGRIKAPFQRENLISSSKQMAVERSSVQETFRIDWTQGVMLDYETDNVRLRASVDQGRKQFSDYNADGVDFAMTGRADLLLAGDWKQTEDFAAWSKDPQSLSIGGGIHYEVAETGTAASAPDMTNSSFIAYTVDGLYKNEGLTLYLAGYGRNSEDGLDPSTSMDDYGLEAMIAYMVVPDTLEPFFRYGRIMLDGDRVAGTSDSKNINEFTVGINWYQHKHAAKLTVDCTYFDAPLHNSFLSSGRSSGLGLAQDAEGEDGQLAVRAQYQLLF